MKKVLIAIITASALLSSCKKEDSVRKISSYTIINATTDVVNARAYAAANTIFWNVLPATDAAAQYRSAQFGAWAGPNIIRAVSGADTSITLFSSSKAENFEEAKSSTLFLCGSTGAYEGIFINNDNIINRTDSVMGIRFINLSANSSPVNITLSTTPTVNEAAALAYKQITNFKTYPALQSTAAMIFQLRDAGGVLQASYTLPITPVSPYTTVGIPYARFKSITLVVKGLQGTTSGTNAFGVFPVGHY
jgi:hypothetical protein